MRHVVAGDDGVLAGARDGAVVIDLSTVDPQTARDMASLASDRGVDYLDAPVSGGVQAAEAGALTIMVGGEAAALERARPILSLLLLDEPSMGIAPVLVDRIYETIAELNRRGTTILLVEQNANYALEVSHRGYVLETGTIALADTSENLRSNPEVQAAYLGGD